MASYDSTKLPFFVYGTLQKGFKNHAKVLGGFNIDVMDNKCFYRGAKICHFKVGYPGMYLAGESEDKIVYGELVDIDSNHYQEALMKLDELEEYFGPQNPDNLYDREKVYITTSGDDKVLAWAYFCKVDIKKSECWVDDGDWKQFMKRNNFLDCDK